MILLLHEWNEAVQVSVWKYPPAFFVVPRTASISEWSIRGKN